MTKWAEYDHGLRRRGDLTDWISENAFAFWAAPPQMRHDCQAVYSDLAVELCLTPDWVFKQPLRTDRLL